MAKIKKRVTQKSDVTITIEWEDIFNVLKEKKELAKYIGEKTPYTKKQMTIHSNLNLNRGQNTTVGVSSFEVEIVMEAEKVEEFDE